MAYLDQITLRDGPQLDSFGRLRVSTPNTLIDNNNQYDKGNLVWNEAIIGTGSSTHRPFQSSVLLSTGGTAKYAGITRQTKDYIRYYPGKSQLVEMTGTLSTTAMDANSRSRIGQFDDFNGMFFENAGGTVSVVLRDHTGSQYASTPDQFTKFLAHCENVTTETALNASLSAVGSTTASTTQKKFGTYSWLFNGSSGMRATLPDNEVIKQSWDIDSGDFTIDLWVYVTTLATNATIVENRTAGGTGWVIGFDGTASPNTKLSFYYTGSTRVTSTTAFPTNQWVHVALVRKDGVFTLYQNGVSAGTYTDGVTPQVAVSDLWFGQAFNATARVANLTYMDEIRVLKGWAYWTAAFTPPTGAYSDVTGLPTDTKIPQSSWNIDKMDGTDVSGVTVDWTKEQIFVISYQALLAGRIIYALDIDGVIMPVHQILNANAKTGPYISNPHLPLRYELHNTGTASGTMTMLQTCVAIHSEGGQESISDHSYHHAVSNGTTAVAVTTRRPILSIRLKNPFNNLMNRIHVLPAIVSVFAKTNDAYVEVIYNGTLSGTPAWTSAGTNSGVEYDVAANGISGGEVVEAMHLAAGTVAAGGSTEKTDISWRYPIALGLHGQPSTVLSIVVTSLSGTTDVRGVINYEEIY